MDNITLKNLKHAEKDSKTTHCFSATVYLNNARALVAKNDGAGGPDEHVTYEHQPPESFNEKYAQVCEAARDWVQKHDPAFLYQADRDPEIHAGKACVERCVNELINDTLILRRMQISLRKKITYRDRSTDRIYALSERPSEDKLGALRRSHPHWELFADMSSDEARLRLWKRT